MNTISFPGLGIDEFTVKEVALSLFGGKIQIRWYGILITLGIILAVGYVMWRAKYEGISSDDVLDLGIFVIIFGVIGARTYYVLTYGISNFIVKNSEGHVKLWDSFISIIGTWNGGIAIYGALIAGVLTVYFVCRHKKINFLKCIDMIAPAVMIGQIIGRWGNFVNGEAYGYEVTSSSPLYFLRMGLLPNIESATKMHYFHPTFLYESVWNLIGFIIINALYKKKKFNGQIFLMYATWYGFGRMFIEGLRTDSLYIGTFRISQVVGFICFIAGVALLVVGFTKARRAACEVADYEPVYKSFVRSTLPTKKTETTSTPSAVEDNATEEQSDPTDKIEKQENEDNDNGENN